MCTSLGCIFVHEYFGRHAFYKCTTFHDHKEKRSIFKALLSSKLVHRYNYYLVDDVAHDPNTLCTRFRETGFIQHGSEPTCSKNGWETCLCNETIEKNCSWALCQLVPVLLAAPLHPRRREPEPEPEPELQLVRVTLVMAVPFTCCMRELQVWLQWAILPTKSNSCNWWG